MSDDTLLVLTGIGIPDYSARGLTQTLEPIEAALSQRRTVNGGLKDLSFAQFRKYKSSISCASRFDVIRCETKIGEKRREVLLHLCIDSSDRSDRVAEDQRPRSAQHALCFCDQPAPIPRGTYHLH
jgi:hypothetical protein